MNLKISKKLLLIIPFWLLSRTIVESNPRLLINEFMIYNNTILNEEEEANDWIELYNGGKDTLSLRDLFISDRANELKRFPLPPINLAPDEYYLLWGGKSDLYPMNHIGFSLSFDETIIISSASGKNLDQVKYNNFISKDTVSYGRTPDGSRQWKKQRIPSPNSSNKG